MNKTLTPREREILLLLCIGKTTKEIAKSYHISPYTVDTHRKNLVAKLNVKTGVQLGALAIMKGLVRSEDVLKIEL